MNPAVLSLLDFSASDPGAAAAPTGRFAVVRFSATQIAIFRAARAIALAAYVIAS